MTSKPHASAALLLCLGIVLLLPPIALIFHKPRYLFDIPLPVFYVFGTWLGLIIAAVIVSRRLPEVSE